MAGKHGFEHLRLLLRQRGVAKIPGGGKAAALTKANKENPAPHSRALLGSAEALVDRWKKDRQRRVEERLPPLPAGSSFVLQVDPGLDIDELRDKFSFEIVAEQEDGFVLVATQDLDLEEFADLAGQFATQARGAGVVASVHRLFDDDGQLVRLRKILSDSLLERWPGLRDDQLLIVDLGIACTGTVQVPRSPKSKLPPDDSRRVARQQQWEQKRDVAFRAWDELRDEREADLRVFLDAHQAEIIGVSDDAGDAAKLPDSVTVRVKLSGKALRDVVLNHPFVFEVAEPDDITLPQFEAGSPGGEVAAAPTEPSADAPIVCIIDSGIQEQHVLLGPAIDAAASMCFLPNVPATDVADYVKPNGHGTRVAGAVLFGEQVPRSGKPPLPFWIQNARVLDANNVLPTQDLFPPSLMVAVVERFRSAKRAARIFNQSINATRPCRTVHMSAWAAAIDHLSEQHDVLFVQSAGNVSDNSSPLPDILEHLTEGRQYPEYLNQPSSRIANPAQSLQALTVGSVGYGAIVAGDWRSFADAVGRPSAFSRSGLGIWDVVKPEVVEFGGDAIRDSGTPPNVAVGGRAPDACPELVRSTMFAAGPAFARDAAGTSFATPKVARIAAQVQAALPDQPALLYRALVVQSARWPDWAERLLAERRAITGASNAAKARKEELGAQIESVVRWLGYGIPDGGRASTNTDSRTTLITSGTVTIGASECHVYQVPIPEVLRRPGNDFEVRIEVTLSFVASPRRTRRTLRHYLSTWVSWRASAFNDRPEAFCTRVLKDIEGEKGPIKTRGLPWTLHEKAKDGLIRNVRRGAGTVQKDWAVVKSADLPESFCIAVVGHRGWNRDPDANARYCLAVTIEVQGQEIAIYDALRTEVEALAVEVESHAGEVHVEVDS